MAPTGENPIGELVDGMLGQPRAPRTGNEAELWSEALDGLRARLREQGALPGLPDARPAKAVDDPFGLDPEAIERARPFFEFLYRRWFRVQSHGFEHVPEAGPAILVANHGGVLPFDAAMLIMDGLHHGDPPRVLRTLVDRFVAELPVVSPFYAAMGQVTGTRENFRALLARGDRVLVFPEGAAGISKSFFSRFVLEDFHSGFVEEALRAQVPIVPVAVRGPESQAPVIADLRQVGARLGLPAFPITPTFPLLGPLGLIPLPVQYRVRYGPPIPAEDLFAVGPDRAALEVRNLIQSMLAELRPR
ncbi:MAG: acyltransferase family protein [bacterium]|nr:acyltransferase family protein [bacterium]MCP5066523.1 acyltransferase family protein [bacterium]